MKIDRRPIVVNLPELMGKLPPWSLEAEKSLLGSILLQPEILADITPILKGPGDFYLESHNKIYETAVAVYDQKRTLDLVLLIEELKARKILPQDDEEMGEAIVTNEYVCSLAECVPSAVNAVHYAGLVATSARTRRMAEAAAKMLHAAYNLGTADEEAVYQAIDEAQAQLFELAERRENKGAQSLAELLDIEMKIQEQESRPKGLKCGLYELDDKMSGWHRGELTIVGARPSVGKTAFAMSVGLGCAMTEGVPVGIFSMEMSKQEITRRFITMETGIELHHFRSGIGVPKEHYKDFLKACGRMHELQLHVDDTPNMTITQLRTNARRMVTQRGIQILFIDYVQLMTAPESAENRQTEVSSISRGLKGLARELDIPVVALCQLNRKSTDRTDNKPRMSDLRESGALEQDADNILLIHREEVFHAGEENWASENPALVNCARIFVEKQRNGPQGFFELNYKKEHVRFRSLPTAYEHRGM